MLESSTSQSQPLPVLSLEPSSPPISQKREQILQGAMQVFLKSGYAETSMDQVAAEAGVSKQTIYSHFQDKEGLFKALMERLTIDRFRAVFSFEEFENEPVTVPGEPELVLRKIADTYLTLVVSEDYLSLKRLIIAESVRFPELAELFVRTVIQRGQCLLKAYFDAHPELGIADSQVMAQIFFGSLVSFVLCQEILHGKNIIPMDRDRLVNSLIHLIINQVKPE